LVRLISVSPFKGRILPGGRHRFDFGELFTWHDDKSSPPVAVVNGEFARQVLGSATNAVGGYYKMRDGTRVQLVGIAEDGKYNRLTEDPLPAMFSPDPAITVEFDGPRGAPQPRSAAAGRSHKENPA